MSSWSKDDGNWLAGITDGEGHFAIAARRRRLERNPDKLYRGISFLFKLSLRSDDEPTLVEAKRILGVGRISLPNSKNRECQRGTKSYAGNPISNFVVQRCSDLPTVIAFFRRFPLRSKKQRDFLIWSHAAELYNQALKDVPRLVFRSGIRNLGLSAGSRPVKGSPLLCFYTIPDAVFSELESMATELKDGRKYSARI